MWLNEAGNDPKISLDDVPVEQGGGTVGGGPDLHEGVLIFWLVIENSVVGDNFRCEHCFEFLPRIGSMSAELVEQGDVIAWPTEMFEQPGNDPFVRCGSGEVGECDTDFCIR